MSTAPVTIIDSKTKNYTKSLFLEALSGRQLYVDSIKDDVPNRLLYCKDFMNTFSAGSKGIKLNKTTAVTFLSIIDKEIANSLPHEWFKSRKGDLYTSALNQYKIKEDNLCSLYIKGSKYMSLPPVMDIMKRKHVEKTTYSCLTIFARNESEQKIKRQEIDSLVKLGNLRIKTRPSFV